MIKNNGTVHMWQLSIVQYTRKCKLYNLICLFCSGLFEVCTGWTINQLSFFNLTPIIIHIKSIVGTSLNKQYTKYATMFYFECISWMLMFLSFNKKHTSSVNISYIWYSYSSTVHCFSFSYSLKHHFKKLLTHNNNNN